MGYNNESIEDIYDDLVRAVASGDFVTILARAVELKNAYYDLEMDYEKVLDTME